MGASLAKQGMVMLEDPNPSGWALHPSGADYGHAVDLSQIRAMRERSDGVTIIFKDGTEMIMYFDREHIRSLFKAFEIFHTKR